MKKILTGLVIFFVSIIVILVTYWSYHVLDDDLYKYRIKELVKKHTGRILKIDGAFGITIGWYPTISMDQVSLSNASWGTQPQMLTADKISVKIFLPALMRRKLETKKVVIDGAHFLLEENAKGELNWPILEGGTATDPKVLQTYPRMDIRNSTLLYQDLVSQKKLQMSFETLMVDFSHGKDQVMFDLKGQYDNIPLQGHIVLDLDKTHQYAVQMDGQVAGNDVSAKGTLYSPATLTINMKGTNTALLKQWFGITLPANAHFSVTTDLQIKNHQYHFSNIQLSVNDSRMTGQLTLTQQEKGWQAAGSVAIQSDNAGQFLKDFNINPSFTGGSLQVTTNFDAKGQTFSQWLSSVTGQLNVALLKTTYSGKATSDLAKLLGKGQTPTSLPINCFIGHFNIDQGVAQTPAFVFDGPGATVYGKGLVNLVTQQLNVSMQPQAKSMQLLSLAVPVQVTGSLDNPNVSAKIPKKHLMLAVLTMASGVGLVGSVGVQMATTLANRPEANPCLQALKKQ